MYNKSFREYYRKYQAIRIRTEKKFKLDRNISRSIRRALKYSKSNKENHWKLILGYTIRELRLRLESTIPEGYTWQDYIDRGLELDHIIPARYFNYNDKGDSDFRRSWALNNLRLLPKKINRIKGGSLKSHAVKAECLVG